MLSGDALVVLICVSLAFANCFSGYDTASVSAVIADQRFLDEFHFSAAMQGAFAVLINVGNCLAYLGPLSLLNHRFGRKVTMTVGNAVLLTGVALVAGARNEGMLLFGRVLCGMGVSLCQGSFAGWAVELASAKVRGTAVCIVQVSYNLGVFIAFWVSLGTTKIPGTNAWRTIVALQVIFGVVLFVATLFAPESPRMLLLLSKTPSDDCDAKVVRARANLCYIRRRSSTDPALIQEWNELQSAAELQQATRNDYSVRKLVRSRPFWRRVAIGAGSCVFAQLTGVAALMLYGITVFESLGLKGDNLSLITNGVSGSIQLVACLFAVFFVDRLGRRKVMIIGLSIACAGYLFLGALFERWPQATNKGAGAWMVVCIFAIQCSYAGAMGPIAYLIAAEIWPQPLRETGISISLFSLFVAVIVVNQLWPVLSDLISFRLYWIMLGVNLVTLTLVYAYWPETKGRTLEAMDSLFGELDVSQRVGCGKDVGAGVVAGVGDVEALDAGENKEAGTSKRQGADEAGSDNKVIGKV